MAGIILHHYPVSPFAEKARLALGFKGLAWRSVIIPAVMPKPDLMPLTGGYRKTPVMQIGADIYCDTQCIVRELERRFPEPSFYRGTDAGTANALAFWCERALFSPLVGVVFGAKPDMLTPEFIEDRSRMIGREIKPDQLKAATPRMLDIVRPQMAWLEMMLADGRAFLAGQHPTLVDLAAYHQIWFLRVNIGANTPPLDEMPKLQSWAERVQQIGHGRSTPMTSQEALAVAKAATPHILTGNWQERIDVKDPFGRKPGARLQVTPDDSGRDPVAGELIALSTEEIVLRRNDPQVGEVAVHFPRAGYVVQPAPPP